MMALVMAVRAEESTLAIRPKSNSANVGLPCLIVTYRFPDGSLECLISRYMMLDTW